MRRTYTRQNNEYLTFSRDSVGFKKNDSTPKSYNIVVKVFGQEIKIYKC